LDGKDRRLLLLDQVYAAQIETSAEIGNVGFFMVLLAKVLAQTIIFQIIHYNTLMIIDNLIFTYH